MTISGYAGRNLDQEMAGIDIITGGEAHRRTHNRHSPPNAMLNYFKVKFLRSRASPSQNRLPNTIRTGGGGGHPPGRDLMRRSPTQPISASSPNFRRSAPLPATRFKTTMTGPHFLTAVAYDEGTVKLAESRLGQSRVGRLNGRDDNGSRPDLRRLSLPR